MYTIKVETVVMMIGDGWYAVSRRCFPGTPSTLVRKPKKINAIPSEEITAPCPRPKMERPLQICGWMQGMRGKRGFV
jgi:hypothetical protein